VIRLCLLSLLLGTAWTAQAGEIQWKKSPIQTHWSFGGMDYSLAGQKLEDFQDFQDLIQPLQDPEANRLLAQAQDEALIGSLGKLAGSLSAGWGGAHLLFDDSPASHSNHLVFLCAGLGLDLLASLLSDDGQKAKYNAVERYNRLVRGEDNSLPAMKLPQDEKSLLPASK